MNVNDTHVLEVSQLEAWAKTVTILCTLLHNGSDMQVGIIVVEASLLQDIDLQEVLAVSVSRRSWSIRMRDFQAETHMPKQIVLCD